MNGTAGPGGQRRLGRFGASLLLVVPLIAVTAASGPSGADPAARAAAPTAPARVTYAGTGHRSLGRVTGTEKSDPLFGEGPAHYDVQATALGDTVVFASRRDEKRPQIYLRAPDGSVRKLTTGRDAAHPRLTPDGGSVVFDSAEPGGPDGKKQRDLWRVGTDGDGLSRLTDTPYDEQSPTVSADGQRLAYSANPVAAAGPQIYVRPLAGGYPTALTGTLGGQATEPVFNPVNDAAHRDLLAYTYTADSRTGPRLRQLGGPGGDQPLLAGTAAQWRTHGAAWMPDGNGVLFLSVDHTCSCEGDWNHVWRSTANPDQTPDPTLLLSENRDVSSVTWVGPPDGGYPVVDRLSEPAPAVQGVDATPDQRVATLQDVRMDGSDPRDLGVPVLQEDPAADTNADPTKDPLFQPAPGYDPWTERQNYTPDGRRIVVTRFENGGQGRIEQIWTADADGTNPVAMRLAGRGPDDWDTDPTFSPDGRYLAFTRTSPGGVGSAAHPGRILIADTTTGTIVHEIVPPAGERTGGDAQPTWSPDGTMLAFTRNEVIGGNGGNKHIWTVPVDAPGGQHDLTGQQDLSTSICPGDCSVIDDSPAFSPDGRSIVFNRKNGGGLVDERNGLVLTSVTGSDCRVLLPQSARDTADACHRELPDTTLTGPHQPRDAAWTADGSRIVFSARDDAPVNCPEHLYVLTVATGRVTNLTAQLPGRQKEPGVQQSVDLAVHAPDTASPVPVGSSTDVRVDVVDNGPAASPGTRLTVAPPTGVTVTRISYPGGSCDAASLQCDLGVVPPGTTVPVTVTVRGETTGDQPLGWSVAGSVIDPEPGDNAARTVVPVRPPAPPTPTPTPTPTPAPPPPPPAPPAPKAGPGVTVTAQPNPGYVGGRVVVTYTVRNGRNALATGLRLRIGLPAGIPSGGPPPGCDRSWLCALPDLPPGDSTVVRVVLAPDHALTGRVTGVLTTTGTDADPGDNRAATTLRILQPKIVAVPPIGKPGFVTSVRGKDFPPGVPVRFTWQPGITAAAAPTRPGPDGTFIGQLLILAKDQTGPRTITARGPGFSPVKTDFLVVTGSVQPPDEVTRR
ncbi:TolB family protein [Streptomyces sp. SCPE 10]|uniref:TolB family protein n=1 Tax=Streptomyces sp. SCPE 10 TaxID=3449273 RepID=UPI003F7E3C52